MPITASIPKVWSRWPTARSGSPTNTVRSWCTSTPMERAGAASPCNGPLPRRAVAAQRQPGHGGADDHPRRLDAGRHGAVGAEDARPRRLGEIGAVGADRDGRPGDQGRQGIPLPLANPQETKVAVSEITALSDTTFLIDERDGELQPGGDKKIYVADISQRDRRRTRRHGAGRCLPCRRRRTAGRR